MSASSGKLAMPIGAGPAPRAVRAEPLSQQVEFYAKACDGGDAEAAVKAALGL